MAASVDATTWSFQQPSCRIHRRNHRARPPQPPASPDASPTLAAQLAARSAIDWHVLELQPAEVMHRDLQPSVVWASRPQPRDTADLRRRLPCCPLLVSLPRHSTPALVVEHYDLGADLVIEDEGITYAAAAAAALGRRLPEAVAVPHLAYT